MKNLKQELQQEAEEKHGKIYPSGRNKELEDCYTEHEGQLMFWFNLEDRTTKMLARKIRK